MTVPVVLSIAGSDSSGGAGIQADLKTIMADKLYGETVITSVTAQNTLGVQGVMELPPEFVSQQIHSVFDDIRPDAIKIGMTGSPQLIEAIADALTEYHAEHIVVDPVMVATTGARLLPEESVKTLEDELLPLAEIVTPNMSEASVLAGFNVETKEDMEKAAQTIQDNMGHGFVLVKGGHLSDSSDDVLCTEHDRLVWMDAPKVKTQNTHGTGCTLSSAIACGLARGLSAQAAVAHAKKYVNGAIKHNLGLGKGNGPLNHMWDRSSHDLF